MTEKQRIEELERQVVELRQELQALRQWVESRLPTTWDVSVPVPYYPEPYRVGYEGTLHADLWRELA